MACNFKNYIDKLETIVQRIGNELPAPGMLIKDDGMLVRHHPRDRSDILMCYLKVVRNLSLLRAAVCLMENGFVQENYVLCRLIEEANEEIMFLSLPAVGTSGAEDKKRMVNEFFQEELADMDNSQSIIPRDRVPRRKIHAATAKRMQDFADPHTISTHLKRLHQLLSGFVHGAYVFIMETYLGSPGRFHTNGLKGTVRMDECEENFPNLILRTIYSAEAIAHRVKRTDLAIQALKLGCAFARETAIMEEVHIVKTEGRIAALSSQ